MDDKIPKVLFDGIAKADLQKPDRAALILDFSGVPAADNRTVFCAFVRYFEDLNVKGLKVRLLSSNAISLIFPVTERRAVDQFVTELNSLLMSHRFGKIDSRYFDLDNSANEFAQSCAQYLMRGKQALAEVFREFYQQPPEDIRQLAELVEVERIVGQADMSMHLRRQLIWSLAKNQQPRVFGEEIWVSIAAMDEVTGKNIIQNPWMFSRFTELLDNRVLSHLAVDDAIWEKRLFVNLNPVAVVSSNFEKVVKSLPYQRLEQLTLEMDLVTWQQNSATRNRILASLQKEGIALALDGISVSQLHSLSEEEIAVCQSLKVHVSPLEGADLYDVLSKCSPEVRAKIICSRCETVEQLEAAINAGVRYCQGYGLSAFVSDPAIVERVLGPIATPPEDTEPAVENNGKE